MSAIEKLKEEGVDLIITVDNGIAAVNEVRYARDLGIKVVVTDHHLPSSELPDANAVVDPHRPDDISEFKEICGVFVAYKVVCATEGKSAEELLADYGDLVALGTVADVMPLVNENRTVVREGVNLISNGSRRGLTALCRAAGIENDTLTSSRLAFGLAPRINAAGRMGDAARACELLLTDDDEVAEGLSSVLNNENIRRQGIEKQIYTEALCFEHFNKAVHSFKHRHIGIIIINHFAGFLENLRRYIILHLLHNFGRSDNSPVLISPQLISVNFFEKNIGSFFVKHTVKCFFGVIVNQDAAHIENDVFNHRCFSVS
jgi:single-stranded-DNA-specific exonuclease RecJ